MNTLSVTTYSLREQLGRPMDFTFTGSAISRRRTALRG